MNPDRLKQFLVQPPSGGSTLRSSGMPRSAGASMMLPSLKSASLSSLAESAAMAGASRQHSTVLQVAPLQRGDLKVFQTTFRGGANLLAPPAPELRSPGTVVVVPSLAEQSPDVGREGGRSLRQVWEKSLFAHAAGLPDVDTSKIMKTDEEGNMQILRIEPDRFYMGRVLRPKVHVETVNAAALNGDGAYLMSPAQRRAEHDAEVNARQGHLALREAYKARRKLALNCSINYPHGVLGCSDTPYAVSGLSSDIYAEKAQALIQEETKAQRKGRGAGLAKLDGAPAKGLEIGVATDRPPRQGGRGHAATPKDTLNIGRMVSM